MISLIAITISDGKGSVGAGGFDPAPDLEPLGPTWTPQQGCQMCMAIYDNHEFCMWNKQDCLTSIIKPKAAVLILCFVIVVVAEKIVRNDSKRLHFG